MTKTLGSFGINLNGNPSLGQILTQVRGELVEVTAPNPISGTLLGVEKKTESIGEGSQHRVVEQEYVTLLTDDGIRALSLAQVQRIKLTNTTLNSELQQALAALATNHDTQSKRVSITFDGTGSRQARVSYLTETPVWKTTYRLVLDGDKAPYLQGWAIVENQTPQDWRSACYPCQASKRAAAHHRSHTSRAKSIALQSERECEASIEWVPTQEHVVLASHAGSDHAVRQ